MAVGAARFLRITRSVKTTQFVPLNEEYYPGLTEDEARSSEYDMALGDKLEVLVSTIDNAEFNMSSWTGKPDQVQGDFSETVVIVEEQADGTMMNVAP